MFPSPKYTTKEMYKLIREACMHYSGYGGWFPEWKSTASKELLKDFKAWEKQFSHPDDAYIALNEIEWELLKLLVEDKEKE